MTRYVVIRALLGAAACALAWGCTGSAPVTAEEQAADAAPQRPCQGDEFRHFDFWIGEWDVMVAGGKKAGQNRIEPVNGGCALLESYATANGYSGNSFNIYDAARGVWHQTWVDNTGMLLTIEGGLRGQSMVMTGTGNRKTPQGEVLDRISWTPADDGTVRQLWEVSADAGVTWKVIFDGNYVRRPGGAENAHQD